MIDLASDGIAKLGDRRTPGKKPVSTITPQSWLGTLCEGWKQFRAGLEMLACIEHRNRLRALDKYGDEIPEALHPLMSAENVSDSIRPPVNLPDELRARLDKAATAARVSPEDIMREGIARVVSEFESTGSIRFGLTTHAPATARQGTATGKRAAMVENAALLTLAGLEKHPDRATREAATRLARRFLDSATACQCHATPIKPDAKLCWRELDLTDWEPETLAKAKANARKKRMPLGEYLLSLANPQLPPPAALSLKPRHEELVRKAAAMLEIKPQTLLDWHLADYVRDLFQNGGLLGYYAVGGLIEYDPETAERVRARFLKWELQTFGKNLNHGEASKS